MLSTYILSREDRWFERRVKESIYVKLEWPSSIEELKNHSHLGLPDKHHEGQLGQRLTSVLNNSVRKLPHIVQKPVTPLQLVRTDEALWMVKHLQETKKHPVAYDNSAYYDHDLDDWEPS